jgi:1-deoxyxylulose-5-phosphate synthase
MIRQALDAGIEVAQLEAPYTPRYDFQGISDPAVLAAISKRVGIAPADGE